MHNRNDSVHYLDPYFSCLEYIYSLGTAMQTRIQTQHRAITKLLSPRASFLVRPWTCYPFLYTLAFLIKRKYVPFASAFASIWNHSIMEAYRQLLTVVTTTDWPLNSHSNDLSQQTTFSFWIVPQFYPIVVLHVIVRGSFKPNHSTVSLHSVVRFRDAKYEALVHVKHYTEVKNESYH